MVSFKDWEVVASDVVVQPAVLVASPVTAAVSAVVSLASVSVRLALAAGPLYLLAMIKAPSVMIMATRTNIAMTSTFLIFMQFSQLSLVNQNLAHRIPRQIRHPGPRLAHVPFR